MSTPGGYSAGTIFLSVVPSFRGFHERIREEGKTANRERERDNADRAKSDRADAGKRGDDDAHEYAGHFRQSLKRSMAKTAREVESLKIHVDVDDGEVAVLATWLKEIGDATVNVDFDDGAALAEIATLKSILESLATDATSIEVKANVGKALAEIEGFTADIKRLAAMDVEVPVKVNERNLGKFATDLRASIEAAIKALPDIQLDADATEADHQIDQIRGLLASLDTDFTVRANTLEAKAQIERVMEELKQLSMESPDIHIVVNSAKALAELRRVKLKAEELDHQRVGPTVHTTNNGTTSFRAFSGLLLAAITLGLALIPILTALAGGIAAIGVAAIGAGVGLGVMLLAFSGISGAVKALGAAKTASPKDALAEAKAMRSAANGVRDATEGVQRAREQAADSMLAAARQVEDALRRETRAQRDLSDAQKDAKKAQVELSRARKDAANQALALALRARGGALAERQGVVDLFNATVSNANAQSDGGATNLDKENAAIALGQAQLALEQIRIDNAQTSADRATFAKTGVEGSAGVVSAKEGVVDANRTVKDRELDLKLAVEATTQARKDQTKTAVDGARQVADATRRLADAQDGYAEATSRFMEIGSAKAAALKEAMAKLGPAGQEFAKFIFGLKGGFKVLRDAAQQGFLPGLTTALQGLITTYGPGALDFVAKMGKTLGDLAIQAGKALQGPAWQDFFGMLDKYAPIFTTLFSESLGSFLEALLGMATALAPFTVSVMQGLADMMTAWGEWARSDHGKKSIEGFGNYVLKVGPKVLTFIGKLVDALVNLGKGLAPYAEDILKIFGGFLDFVAGMPPSVLGALTIALIGFIGAVQLLLGIAKLMFVLEAVASLLGVVIPAAVATAIATFFFWVAIIAAVVLAFVILYKNCETFRNIVNGVFHVVGAVIGWFWNKIVKPIFAAIVGTIRFLYNVITAVFSLIFGVFKLLGHQIADWWGELTGEGGTLHFLVGFWDGVVEAWSKAVDGLSYVWDKLTGMAKTAIRFVIDTVINDGLIAGFNWLADKVGSKKIPRIQLPSSFYDAKSDPKANQAASSAKGNGVGGFGSFASGGMVPGTSPHDRADNIPAWLTAGEYVLPVKAVRNLRDQHGSGFLEMLRQGSMPGYAAGGPVKKKPKKGILDKIGDGLSGAASWAGGTIKDAAGAVIGSPVKYLLDKVKGLFGYLNDTAIGCLITGVPLQAAKDAGNFLLNKIGLGSSSKGAPTGQGNAEIRSLIQTLASPYGWGGGDMWTALQALVNSESGFNPNAQNKTSTAYGLFQFLNGTWGPGGIAKTSDPARQTTAGLEYIKGRYGNPMNAWAFHKANNWYADGGDVAKPTLYDDGGWLPPGLSTVLNATGRPEPVLTAKQWDRVGSEESAGHTFPVQSFQGATAEEIADELMHKVKVVSRGGVYARKQP